MNREEEIQVLDKINDVIKGAESQRNLRKHWLENGSVWLNFPTLVDKYNHEIEIFDMVIIRMKERFNKQLDKIRFID